MIKKETEIFGLSFLGDGDTISRWPLLNILASAKNIPVYVFKIVGSQVNLYDGNKKDRKFICNQLLNHTKEIDPAKTLSDIVIFNGASNMQLAGIFLKVHYPKLTVMRGDEHTVSLFLIMFKDTHLNQNIYSHKMICNIFGSGIYHKPHSIF